MKLLILPIAPDMRWDESVMRAFAESLPYHLTGARAKPSGDRQIELLVPGHLDEGVVRHEANALLSTVIASLRDGRERVLREHDPVTTSTQPDPMLALTAGGEVKFTGRGRAVYGGSTKLLVDALDSRLGRFAIERGAVSQNYPSTVDRASLVRSGYLRAFPHHAMFVAAAAENADALKAVTESVDGVEPISGALGPHDQVLAPTVCYHCFEALRGATLPGEAIYTAVGSCHRFEILAATSLDRLQTYRMREVIAFGRSDQVTGTLDALLEMTESLLARWGLPFRVVTATDPFFFGALKLKAYFQAVFELKRELQVRLDFSGRWLAIASFNDHQQSLTQAFDITAGSGKLDSSCTGWGLERFAYALLARFGTDPARWPRQMLADLAI